MEFCGAAGERVSWKDIPVTLLPPAPHIRHTLEDHMMETAAIICHVTNCVLFQPRGVFLVGGIEVARVQTLEPWQTLLSCSRGLSA